MKNKFKRYFSDDSTYSIFEEADQDPKEYKLINDAANKEEFYINNIRYKENTTFNSKDIELISEELIFMDMF